MNTETGQIYMKEEALRLLDEEQAKQFADLKGVIVPEGESMPKGLLKMDNLPDPNCWMCNGSGHKPRRLATQRYIPCKCTQKKS